jgi:hypothetical protein
MTNRSSIRLLAACVLMFAASAAAAQEAALPEDAVCAAYGPGFRALAGTEVCVKLGGSVRVDAGYVSRGGLDAKGASPSSGYTTTTKGKLRLDARTETDFGTVRFVFDIDKRLGEDWPGER